MSKQVVKLTRQEKGKLLWQAGKVYELTKSNDLYFVESETDSNKGYEVLYTLKRCECDDYANRQEPCKHFYAVWYYKTECIRQTLEWIQVKALSQVGEVIQCNRS